MPYPILSLPYPFAKRLPQLLSPLELQNLQIAAGHFKGQLKPNVLTYTVYFASFEGDDHDVITVGERQIVKIPNTKVLYKCNQTFFESLTDAVLNNDHFNNTGYKSKIVTMKNCKISTKFLENIAKKLTKLEELYIEDENKVDKEVKFPLIFNLFPFCYSLAITTAYHGWVRDLIGVNISTKIKRLSIEHDDLEELISIDEDELHRFFEQHSDILMRLTYSVPGSIQESEEYFEKRFNATFTLPKRFEGLVDIYFKVKSMNTDFCFVNGFV